MTGIWGKSPKVARKNGKAARVAGGSSRRRSHQGGQNGQGFVHQVGSVRGAGGLEVVSGSSHFRITCHFNAVPGPQN